LEHRSVEVVPEETGTILVRQLSSRKGCLRNRLATPQDQSDQCSAYELHARQRSLRNASAQDQKNIERAATDSRGYLCGLNVNSGRDIIGRAGCFVLSSAMQSRPTSARCSTRGCRMIRGANSPQESFEPSPLRAKNDLLRELNSPAG